MAKTNWTVDQKKAIDKRDSNILVSASAGSGKTAVLVERIIEKVLNEFLDVDKLLVVTFTNAAAQELKEKILNAIYKALETETDSKKKNHLKNQLIYINRACITTIDAFCFKLVRENFNVLDLDPNVKICEESQSVLIKAKVLEDLIEKEYEKYEDRSAFGLYNILELFGGKEEEFLEEILKIYNYIQAFPYPFVWLKEQIEKYNINENVDLYDTDFGRDIYEDTIAELDLCLVKYDEYLKKLEGLEEFTKAVETLYEDKAMIENVLNIPKPSWNELYSKLNLIAFSTLRFNRGVDEELKEEIKEFRQKEVKDVITKLKKKIYANSNEILKDNKIAYEYMTYLYDFLISFDTAFRAEKKQQSIAEFNDITHFALELLVNKDGTLTDIAKDLKSKFSEVYTDEYQDTSFVQETILSAVSGTNNRFMVGDIKQSIYGFRQARPDIFNEKYIAYDPDDESNKSDSCKIILSQNFRSRDEVIDSINYIFEKIMSMKNGQCEYGQDEALKCGNKSFVSDENSNFTTQINIVDLKEKELNTFDTQEDEEEYEINEDLSKFEIESKCIAYKIKEIVSKDKVMQKDGTLRDATYKDIVILLRGIKDKAGILEEELKRNNILVFSDVATSIFEGDETKLILSFLKVIDNPYQDVYMTSIMYSIIGNFTLDEITKIRLYESNTYIYNTLERIVQDEEFLKENVELVEKINRFLKLINKYMNYSKIYTISELLVKLYKDTNIYYQFALEENAESIKANLDYLIEIASNFYSTVGNTLNAYIKYVDSLKDKSDSSTTSAKIIGENENVVRIMTIHKSKGLEFPIVILGDIGKNYNFMDLRKQKVLFHHKYGIGIDIVNQGLGVTYPSLVKHAIRNVIEKETKSEEIRLLYVALTRAKEKLYLFGTIKDYDKAYDMQSINVKEDKFNESLIGSCNSYLKLILPVLKYYNEYEGKKDKLDINVIKVNENTTDQELKEMLASDTQELNRLSATEIIKEHLDKNVIDQNVQKDLKDNFETEYEHIKDVRTPSRVSVSNLKKAHIEEDEIDVSLKAKVVDENVDIDEEGKEKEIVNSRYFCPSCLTEEEKYTAVRKGLLIHFILQNLDFKTVKTRDELKDYLEKMVYEHVISEQDRKYISVNKIYNFLESQIGQELKDATEVYKEYEFVLNDEKISPSLIQGVIDLFYVTASGKVVLVDFKTDRLTQEQDFIDRYKIQLDIYKEAINTLTNKKVDNTYIYSFNMNKMIELR